MDTTKEKTVLTNGGTFAQSCFRKYKNPFRDTEPMEKKIIEKEVDSEFMLYNAEKGDISVLNPTAKLIYSLCKQNMSISNIADAIKNQFSINENQDLKSEIQVCIDELREKELL